MSLLADQWWPQNPAVLGKDGNWQVFTTYGQHQDVGFEFEIAVATFKGEEEQKILDYRKKGLETGVWNPIQFPKATSNVDMITVKKTSHN